MSFEAKMEDVSDSQYSVVLPVRSKALAKRRYAGPLGSGKRARQSKRLTKLGRKLQLSVHRYKRSYSMDLLTTASGQGTGYYIALNNLPNFAEFTALYDSYRIEWVTVWAIPTQTEAPVQGANLFVPTLYTVVDKDDAAAPGTLASQLEHGNVRMVCMDKMKKVASFKPAVQGELFRSGATRGFNRLDDQWIDCAQADIPHYGLKIWTEPAMTGFNGIRLIADVYVSFKDTR